MTTNSACTAYDLVKANQVVGYHTFHLENADLCVLTAGRHGDVKLEVDRVVLVEIAKADRVSFIDYME